VIFIDFSELTVFVWFLGPIFLINWIIFLLLTLQCGNSLLSDKISVKKYGEKIGSPLCDENYGSTTLVGKAL
jgi:hypothetical protein